MTATNSPKKDFMMYEGRIRYLVKAQYTSKNHAWKLIEAAIPKKLLNRAKVDKEHFMSVDYTMDAPKNGWLIAWLDEPVRWIGKPRPNSLVLQRNGWGSIPDKYVPSSPNSRKPLAGKDDEHEEEILRRTDIGPREKQTLIKARRGQGKFKSNVGFYENRCRVTGIDTKTHLIASHIKPWVNSDDDEKLDGFNGLLLAPHIDHLFDKGFISFKDNGDLLISPKLDKSVLKTWGIPHVLNVGTFHAKQRKYLKYHRERKLLR
ncbi:MAG: HNH endonuclease [Candidatus Nanopelagicaceae bacterium]